jgi:hypothetical protein
MGKAAPGLLTIAGLTLFAVLFLWVESEVAVVTLLAAAAAVVLIAAKLGCTSPRSRS